MFLGEFAGANLKVWQGEYYAIDAWQWRPTDDPADKNFKSERQNLKHMQQARRNVAFAGARAHIMRAKSLEAARQFDDNTFDWCTLTRCTRSRRSLRTCGRGGPSCGLAVSSPVTTRR